MESYGAAEEGLSEEGIDFYLEKVAWRGALDAKNDFAACAGPSFIFGFVLLALSFHKDLNILSHHGA